MRTHEFTVGSFQPDSRPIAYFGPDGTRLRQEKAAAFVSDAHGLDDYATLGDEDSATVTAAFVSGHRAAERVLRREIPIAAVWSHSGI